jgi:HSP20 family protein
MNCATVEKTETNTGRTRTVRPRWTHREDEQAYYVTADLPGVDKAGLSIEVVDDILTVQGRRGASVPESWQPLHRELVSADYRLELDLNQRINPETIQARLENGVLYLTLGKSETLKPRKIEIAA